MKIKIAVVALVWTCVFVLHRMGHGYIHITDGRNVGMEEELAFTTMAPKQSRRVIFLGNCVFQLSQEIPLLNQMKKANGLDFETGNFARQGATIGDLLVAYNYVKRFKPDLLVIHVDPYAFGYHDPFYKHTSRKLLFAPKMSGLWSPVVFSTYSSNEKADSLLYSWFPPYRMLPEYRYRVNSHAKKILGRHLPWPVFDFFPITLTPNFKFLNVSEKSIHTYEFAMAGPVMKFFVDQLEADHQKAVFILQESADVNLPVVSTLPSLFEGKRYVHLYDFQKLWNRVDFKDNVHPREPEGAIKAATRLLQIVDRHLYGPS